MKTRQEALDAVEEAHRHAREAAIYLGLADEAEPDARWAERVGLLVERARDSNEGATRALDRAVRTLLGRAVSDRRRSS